MGCPTIFRRLGCPPGWCVFLQGKTSLSRTDIERIFALYDRVTPSLSTTLSEGPYNHFHHHWWCIDKCSPSILGSPPLLDSMKIKSKESVPHCYSRGTHNIHFHSLQSKPISQKNNPEFFCGGFLFINFILMSSKVFLDYFWSWFQSCSGQQWSDWERRIERVLEGLVRVGSNLNYDRYSDDDDRN